MIYRLLQFWCGCCLYLCLSSAYAEQSYAIDPYCQVNIQSVSTVQTPDIHSHPHTGWQPVTLPDRWNERWPDYNGGVWYKIIWNWSCHEPAVLDQSIVFSINYLNSAGAVFLNRDLIWSNRHLEEPLSKSWNMPRYWILPISGLRPDQNEILVYVRGYAFQSAGLGDVSFQNVYNSYTEYQQQIWDRRTLFVINAILSATLGVLCLVIWLFRRKEVSYGWFALSCLLWLLFVSNIISTETYPFPNTLMAAQANIAFFVLYILSFIVYLLRFVDKKFPILEETAFICSVAVILGIFVTPLDYAQTVFGLVFLGYSLLFFGVFLYLLRLTFRVPRVENILLVICLSLIIIFAALDIALLAAPFDTDLQPLSPYTSPVVTLFIALILGIRTTKSMQKIEQFNQQLEYRVFEVREDLKQSMSEKHYLELENVRLQERIHLSHDLHDGLGASLVRSMIMVDQSEQPMSNRQFLSILKLLRDDLRQIIDSGSSIGAKVPETPVLWIAPVRHRFSQLMDEVEMRATWNIASEWVVQPTPLQCLNLMRVLEESLTNVVKHSQAKHIQVTLDFPDEQTLCLSIQDDGIGFDTHGVLDHGMSIGVRSMKLRLARIGAELKVNSTPGYTLIKAILVVSPQD